MTTLQTDIKTTTQSVGQEPEQNTQVLPPTFTQNVEQGQIIQGQLQPVTTSQIQTSVEGANIEGMPTIQGTTQILKPIYTKEVKEAQIHDLGVQKSKILKLSI